MTGEEMERAIDFLLKSQATLEERNGSRESPRVRTRTLGVSVSMNKSA